MGNSRSIRFLIYSIVPLASQTGCQSLVPPGTPIAIIVRDAETKEPIPNAIVQVNYLPREPARSEAGSAGVSAVDGKAKVMACPSGESGVMVEVKARGFMIEQRDVPVEPSKSTLVGRLVSPKPEPVVPLVMDLYLDPRPTIEFTIPTSYRGLVRAEIRVQDDFVYPVHQREFSYVARTTDPEAARVSTHVPVTSLFVDVVGPPLFFHSITPDFRAKYTDGTSLPLRPKDMDIGLWWVKAEGHLHYFIVGTKLDYEDYRRSIMRDEPAPQKSSGGKGGGGKGGRGGGMGGGRGGMGGGNNNGANAPPPN